MAMTDMDEERRKRINRIRRGIIIVLTCAVIVPIVLCIILLFGNNELKKELAEAKSLLKIQSERLKELTAYAEAEEGSEETPMTDTISSPFDDENLMADSADKYEGEPYCIYLTFDDGPSANTEEILTILREYDVKATFFVNGRTDDDSLMLYEQIAQAGHTVGMHSYTHKYASIYASSESFSEDLDLISELILNTTGKAPCFYRFPGGSSNTAASKARMEAYIKLLHERKIEYVDWNIDSRDAKGDSVTAEDIVANIFSDFGKYHTNVVLLHDGPGHAETVKALPRIIERARNMGAQLLPITEDTVPIQHIKQ